MENFIDIWQYMPHGMCLLWQPWLVVLWAGSDALIFLAYMAIPLSLLQVLRRRGDIQHHGLVLLFAGFIVLCGLTHLLGIITLWWPIYPYVGVVKLATGLVSAITAIVLFRLTPMLIAIPSRAELEAVNRRLRETIAAHEAAEAELRAIKAELENKVSKRTADLKDANTKMAVVAREAVHRSRNLLTVVGAIARQSAREHSNIDDYLTVLLGRLDALSGATATVIGGDSSRSAEFRDVVESQLRPLLMSYGDRIQLDGPTSLPISSEAAQQLGLAVHELATNAQKYGCLSKPSGGLCINWRMEGSGPDRQLVFQWSENHVGVDGMVQPERTGFGHTLLTRVVPSMLQGTARRTVEGGRLLYELRVPTKTLNTDASTEGDATMAARIVDEDFGIAATAG